MGYCDGEAFATAFPLPHWVGVGFDGWVLSAMTLAAAISASYIAAADIEVVPGGRGGGGGQGACIFECRKLVRNLSLQMEMVEPMRLQRRVQLMLILFQHAFSFLSLFQLHPATNLSLCQLT